MDTTLLDLDKSLYSLMAESELHLDDVRCGLNHGIDYDENPYAIDYLCQKFNMKDEPEITLQIPVCSECAAALYSDSQVLFICISCSSSQWVWKEDSNKEYDDGMHVLFFKKCPKCID